MVRVACDCLRAALGAKKEFTGQQCGDGPCPSGQSMTGVVLPVQRKSHDSIMRIVAFERHA